MISPQLQGLAIVAVAVALWLIFLFGIDVL
jgi:hypothetical protein